jgi:hypothetical protein
MIKTQALAKAAKAAHKSANKLVSDAMFAGAPLEPSLCARLE